MIGVFADEVRLQRDDPVLGLDPRYVPLIFPYSDAFHMIPSILRTLKFSKATKRVDRIVGAIPMTMFRSRRIGLNYSDASNRYLPLVMQFSSVLPIDGLNLAGHSELSYFRIATVSTSAK